MVLPERLPGDVELENGTRLRLTLARLYALGQRTGCFGPAALAARLRRMDKDLAADMAAIFAADPGAPDLLPGLARVFEAAFAGGNNSPAVSAPQGSPDQNNLADTTADQDWPFDAWLRIAVRQFGLCPNEFWQTSVRDWLSLMRPLRASPMLTRETLSALRARYPDG